jgi:putative transposase
MKHYQFHAWVVMANHIHVLLTPFVDIARITHSLKRFTSREANRTLGLTGQPFWQDESYDHLVRDAGEFNRIVSYIENNPVAAGLASAPEHFPWSSAARGSKAMAT